MEERSGQVEMAEMLERYEIGLAHLYETFAKKVPEHKTFWDEIASEERTHAFLVRNFRSMMESGELEHGPRPFDATLVHKNLESLSKRMDHARRNPLSMADALEAAIEMENNMIERRVFESMDDDSAELKKVLEALMEGTREHYSKVKEMYRRLKE